MPNEALLSLQAGFARNPPVLQRFAPYLKDVQVLSGTGSLGEGMLMAQAYGAMLEILPLSLLPSAPRKA